MPRATKGKTVWAYLFLAPYLIVLGLFFFLPIFHAFKLSLYSDSMFGAPVFIGFRNYARALADGVFWKGLLNTVLYGLIHMPILYVLAFLLAAALDGPRLVAKPFFRIAIFLPYAVPTLIAGMIWGTLYAPTNGPVTAVLTRLGLPAPDLLSAKWILFSMSNIAIWEYTGYIMIILYAALKAVPEELTEAARIDGANTWNVIRHVKIPGIASTLRVTLVFSIIGTLQLFNEPQIMRSLAPAVIGPSFTPNLHGYTLAFSGQQYSYSAAISFVLGLVTAVISYIFMLTSNKKA